MKGNKSYRSFKKIIIVITILSMLIPIIGILSILTIAATTETSVDFTGYSNGMTASALEDATNAEKNADGTYTNPVSNNQPQITFLIPGFGSQASTWSNNYQIEITEKNGEKQAYNSKSIIEKIRDYANAEIYYADVVISYHSDVYIDGILTEGAINGSQMFKLYEYPDICTSPDCDSCIFENEYDMFNSTSVNTVDKITDISKHIVILFDPADSTGSNSQIYEQFNYVADKIVYDVKTLNGGELPKVNLIGHSRGGLTAMEYALNHPYIVDSIFTMGTPFEGSFFGQSESILSFLGMSADRSSDDFSFGVEDILNPQVYEGYMNRWNEGYDEKYSHINFHAIAGITTLRGAAYIFENDNYYDDDYHTNFWGTLLGTVFDVGNILIDDIIPQDAKLYWHGDMFVHLDSQRAKGYKGVENYVRVFEKDNIDLNMVAEANIAIPHNLEPGDSRIHDYILRYLNTGSINSYVLNTDNTYTLLGRGIQTDSSGVLTIPASYNGLPVTKIAPFAFEGNNEIIKVVIPDSIKEIGYKAFYNCNSLTTVEFADSSTLEIIEQEAFAFCEKLTNISLPETLVKVESYAFYNTEIHEFTIGSAMAEIYPSAFLTRYLSSYDVSDSNPNFSDVSDVLYNKDGTELISYPCCRFGASFTVPATVENISVAAFKNAAILTSIDLGNVTYIPDEAFMGCEALLDITASDLLLAEGSSFTDTAFIKSSGDIKSIGKVLVKYSGNAEELALYDYYSIAPYAFNDATNLQTLTLGGEIYNIGHNAFFDCDNLTLIYLDTGTFVYPGELAFSSSVENRKIYVASSLLQTYQTSNWWLAYRADISTHETVIKFDSNGGTTVDDSSVLYYSYIGDLPIPTRPGYSFAGWTMIVDGQETAVSSADIWISFEREVEFTATWTLDTYSVILHPNFGQLDETNYTFNVYHSLTLPIPTRTGYTFAGWYDNTALEGNAVCDLPVGSTGNRIYYAKWTPNTYTVTLDYAYEGAPEAITQTITYGELFTFPSPERDCYDFDGWFYQNAQYTSDDGTATRAWNIDDNVTLEAKWVLVSYYVKLVINIDGTETYYWIGTTGISQVQAPIEYGQEFPDVEAINNSFNPNKVSIKEGHKFMYFTKDPINSRTVPSKYMFDDVVMNASEDITEIIIPLNAYFVPETNFSISFLDYTDNTSGTSVGSFSSDYGATIVYPNYTKAGYTLTGWRVSERNGNAYDNTDYEAGMFFSEEDARRETMPDLSPYLELDGATIFVEAVLVPKTINIQYDSNGGSSKNNTTVVYGSTSYAFPIPTKNGYSFAGWWYETSGVKYSDSSGTLAVPSWDIDEETVVLKAHWNSISYTIVYSTDGGTHNNPTTYTIESNFVLSDATKTNYKFLGWYTTSSCTTKIESIVPGQTGTKYLYAKFAPIYEATFVDLNGSSTTFRDVSGTSITTPSLDSAYIFVSGAAKIEGNKTYILNRNVTYTAREKTYSECYNSSSQTYEIYTKNQLSGLFNSSLTSSTKVKLQRNISWGGIWNPVQEWRGVFDGNGYSIDDITINVPANSSGGYGMFNTNYGTISHLIINNGWITVPTSTNSIATYIGTLVGTNHGTINDISIYNVSITTQKSESSVGGVVGYNAGICTYCVVQLITIDGYGDMGAVAGTCSGSSSSLKGCYVYGRTVTLSIRGANRSAGGIVGYLTNGAKVEYCSVSGIDFVFGNYANISVEDLAPRVGYIVGHAEGAIVNNVRIRSCTVDCSNLPSGNSGFFGIGAYDPHEYICSAGDGACGLSDNGTVITNTNWSGNASTIP